MHVCKHECIMCLHVIACTCLCACVGMRVSPCVHLCEHLRGYGLVVSMCIFAKLFLRVCVRAQACPCVHLYAHECE